MFLAAPSRVDRYGGHPLRLYRTCRAPPRLALVIARASPSSHDGSPSSCNERKDDLRRALDTAIGSLHVLVSLYGRREMRWIKEKFRLGEDKEKVQLLLNRCSASASLAIGRHDAYILLTLTFCVSLFDF